jgi:threonine aldolase
VKAAIKPPEDHHFAKTRLLCLENTQGGKVLPLDYLRRAHDFARTHRLGLHLDGARLFNAVVKQGVEVREISGLFDTVSVCLSKGLGAPVGSVLCGSREHIAKSRRWRKVLGGGMRQAGVLAAAGIYALQNNVARLAEDHANARALAEGLAQVPGLQIDRAAVQTNMVFITVPSASADPLRAALKQRGILIGGGATIRLVTHLDVTAEDIRTLVGAVAQFFAVQPATRAEAPVH